MIVSGPNQSIEIICSRVAVCAITEVEGDRIRMPGLCQRRELLCRAGHCASLASRPRRGQFVQSFRTSPTVISDPAIPQLTDWRDPRKGLRTHHPLNVTSKSISCVAGSYTHIAGWKVQVETTRTASSAKSGRATSKAFIIACTSIIFGSQTVVNFELFMIRALASAR